MHKLRAGDGSQVTSGGWPVSVTRDASHEKIGSALGVDGRNVLVTTGGYVGDAPPYVGKVVTVDRSRGRIVRVFDSLCSDRRALISPGSCPALDSAIWGRAGAAVDPGTHRIYVTTSNGPFDGVRNWGDSVLELSSGAGRLLRHYTPTNQRQLAQDDADLGSTSPVLLPLPGGGSRTRFLLQGGKDGKLRLLSLGSSLRAVTGAAGRALGGEVQTLPLPGGADRCSRPGRCCTRGPRRWCTSRRAEGRRRTGSRPAASYAVAWQNGTAGTSPVLAGSLLWVYDPGRSAERLRCSNRPASAAAAGAGGALEQPDRGGRARVSSERRREPPRAVGGVEHLPLTSARGPPFGVAMGERASDRRRVVALLALDPEFAHAAGSRVRSRDRHRPAAHVDTGVCPGGDVDGQVARPAQVVPLMDHDPRRRLHQPENSRRYAPNAAAAAPVAGSSTMPPGGTDRARGTSLAIRARRAEPWSSRARPSAWPGGRSRSRARRAARVSAPPAPGETRPRSRPEAAAPGRYPRATSRARRAAPRSPHRPAPRQPSQRS